jgi:hypothetical protein
MPRLVAELHAQFAESAKLEGPFRVGAPSAPMLKGLGYAPLSGDEFFIDLLFYHTRLKCYVVVELKSADFKPEHTGQLNFYLSAVDAQIKAPEDKPSIGLLLCRKQNRLVAEYALSGINKPIGVAEYQLVRSLPEPLDTSLPTIEEIEAELAGDLIPPTPGKTKKP